VTEEQDLKDEIELTPLMEVEGTSEITGINTLIDPLFSQETFPIVLAKVNALESLIKISLHNTNFSEFMRELLGVIIKVVHSEAASILEVNPQNETLFFRAVIGQSSDRVVDFVIPMNSGIAGHAVETRMPVIVNNVPENAEHLRSIEKAVGFETRNMVALPILVRGRVFGVLEILNRVGESNYSSGDIELLTYVCDIAAKIIELRLMINWSKNLSVSIKDI